MRQTVSKPSKEAYAIRHTGKHSDRFLSSLSDELEDAIRQANNPTEAFLNRLRTRLVKLDAMVTVTGPEGYTKSTCARHLAHMTDQSFSKDRIAYGDKEYLKLIRDLPPGSSLIADEGVEMFHNRNSMTKGSKITNEVLMECRIFHLANFICFPRILSIDLYLRDFRTWAWIRCLEPGKAEVRIRNWEIPVGDTIEEAKRAFFPVCGLTYPPIETEEWEQNEQKKEQYIRDKITKHLKAEA